MRVNVVKKMIEQFKKKPLKISISFILIIAILGGTTVVLGKKTNLFGKKTSVQQLTAYVDKGSIKQIIEGSGSVKSSTRKEISSKVISTIQTINFKAGDTVKKGDVLFELDNTDALVDIENAKNSLDEVKLSLQEIQNSISNLTVKAPFSGYVTDFNLKADDNVNGGGVIATITDTSKLKITLPFSGKNAGKIAEGQRATVNIEELMQSLEGTVSYVSGEPYTTGGVQAYDIEITLNNPGSLKSGMSANAEITVGTDTYTSIQNVETEYVNNKIVKSSSGGTVKSINVKKNQHVNAGDVLAVLENESLQSNFNSMELKLKNLESQLAILEKKLTYYTLVAPCNGTIINQTAVIGDTVSAGNAIAVVADMDTLVFSVSIDELDISDIKVGQEVMVTADAIADTLKNPLTGIVSEISMEGTSSNGVTTYPVTITLDKSDKLKTGMNVNGEIFISSKDNVLRVPVEAVKTIDDVSYVYVKNTNSTNTNKNTNTNTIANTNTSTKNSSNVPQPPSGNPPSGSGSTLKGGGTPPQGGGTPPQGNTGGQQNSTGSTNADKNITSSTNSNTSSSNVKTSSSANMPVIKTDSYYSNATLVKVETGISNDTYIEITSGLTEGQIVILPKPSTDSDKTTTTKSTQQQGMPGMDSNGPPSGGGGGGGPGF